MILLSSTGHVRPAHRGAPLSERFEIIRQLGAGGMGVVYEAVDRKRGSRVALKALHHMEPHMLLRLKQEFRSVQGIEHPNLVALLELIHEAEDDKWYFTMELVEGVRLTTWVRPVYDGATLEQSRDKSITQVQSVTMPDMGARVAAPPGAPPVYDEARLRAAMVQLADGISALHRAGKVHRDIKPSNVLVTPAGRVVVLDFGLVTDIVEQRLTGSGVVGTVAYMAPEQAAGRAVGPEADWYSMGVILYEVLTGRLPFSGATLEILQAKQLRPARPPREIHDCPADLAELCEALLRTGPQARPRGEEVLRRLGVEPADRERSWPSLPSGAAPFVGRAAELARLEQALEDVRRGQPRVVLVEGASGVGKSALVRHFTTRIAAAVPGLVLLSGRYYEREAVPFRALDAIMDAVGQFLVRLPEEVAEAFLPVDAPLLGSIFASLRAVPAVSRSGARLPALDPHELRARLFRAVRELFVRLSRKRPLVLVIDDVQWYDEDSRAVFAEAIRPPEGPVMLVLATLRTVAEDPQTAERVRRAFRELGEVVDVRLDALPPAEAVELAGRLLGSGAAPAMARTLAEEAGGHPLFIDALVRHTLLVGEELPGRVRLEDALRTIIAGLDGQAVQVLELLALAGSSMTNEVALRAVGVDYAAFTRLLTSLKAAHLVRGARVREQDAFEPYHDRVRELVAASMSEEQRRRRHEQLARVLESDNADAEALYLHWRGAGDVARAARYAVEAAARASASLRFARAARLYHEALDLTPAAAERRPLWLGLGDALANAGLGPEAAEAYGEALPGSAAHEALDLRRKMAEQLLRSGRFEEGLASVREVLAAVGLKMPRSPKTALAALLVNRARLALRGISFRERTAAEVPQSELVRLDACWSVAGVLGMVDTIRGAYFQSLHLRLSLDAGEPFRVARALALEADFSAVGGTASAARSARLIAEADRLATQVDHPYALGWARGAAGVVAALEGRWLEGYRHIDAAEEIFRSRCGGIAWELSTFQFFLVYSLAYSGQMREVGRRVHRYLREAQERGDRYGAAAHRMAMANMGAWLTAGDAEEARARARDAMREWSRADFQVAHFWELMAHAQIDLYVGDAAAAYQRVKECWGKLDASLLLRVQLTRLEALHLRGRAALALAADAGERASLLAAARKDAARIARERTPWATPLAKLLLAGAAQREGDREAARRHLEEAASGCDAADMKLYAAAARWRLGGAARGEAEAWMASEAVVAPEKMVAMLVPGFE